MHWTVLELDLACFGEMMGKTNGKSRQIRCFK